MVSELIECVPNISEGRNGKLISEIAELLRGTDGVRLLDLQTGYDTNRTVYTCVGTPDAVEKAAFILAEAAVSGIDMRKHRGEHPRIGAVDVIPLISPDGSKRGECIALSHRLGKRIWEDLRVPVYLYGYAASSPGRTRLPDIRKGQYEGLRSRMTEPEWRPDFGDRFNERAGAVAVGVRDLMLAYNVNLNTADVGKARLIAGRVRTSGMRIPGSEKTSRKPGLLQFCQADGWYLPNYGFCQVTMNLHNPAVTGLHHAFEAVKKEAASLGLQVTGSELIGLAPLSALIDAGNFYLRAPVRSEGEQVAEAIRALGLDTPFPFDPCKKILEYKIREEAEAYC